MGYYKLKWKSWGKDNSFKEKNPPPHARVFQFITFPHYREPGRRLLSSPWVSGWVPEGAADTTYWAGSFQTKSSQELLPVPGAQAAQARTAWWLCPPTPRGLEWRHCYLHRGSDPRPWPLQESGVLSIWCHLEQVKCLAVEQGKGCALDSAAQCLLGYPERHFRFQEEVPCAEVHGIAPTVQTTSEHCPEKNVGFEQECSFTALFPNFEDL